MTHELVKKVAQALVSPKADPSDWRWWTDEAKAAIDIVLEEVEGAVGEVGDHADAGAYINAIRALKIQNPDSTAGDK